MNLDGMASTRAVSGAVVASWAWAKNITHTMYENHMYKFPENGIDTPFWVPDFCLSMSTLAGRKQVLTFWTSGVMAMGHLLQHSIGAMWRNFDEILLENAQGL